MEEPARLETTHHTTAGNAGQSQRPGMNEREILRFLENKPYTEFIAAQRFDIGCSIATTNSPISMPNPLSSLPCSQNFVNGRLC